MVLVLVSEAKGTQLTILRKDHLQFHVFFASILRLYVLGSNEFLNESLTWHVSDCFLFWLYRTKIKEKIVAKESIFGAASTNIYIFMCVWLFEISWALCNRTLHLTIWLRNRFFQFLAVCNDGWVRIKMNRIASYSSNRRMPIPSKINSYNCVNFYAKFCKSSILSSSAVLVFDWNFNFPSNWCRKPFNYIAALNRNQTNKLQQRETQHIINNIEQKRKRQNKRF